jgi:choline kinase
MTMNETDRYCAILLCAGVGSRLRPFTDDRPKCLVPIAGTTMLELSLSALARSKVVSRVVIVTGYRAEMVRAVAERSELPVRFAHSDEYASTQNVVSLAAGLREREPGERWMKLDGDLIVDPAIVRELAGAPARVAVDTSVRVGAEEMKVLVDRGRITAFGKGLAPKRCAGESIGVEAFSDAGAERVAAAIHTAVERGRTQLYYEDVYNDVLASVAFEPLAVDGSSWIEVDDLEDLARAETLVLSDPRFSGRRQA